MTTLHLREVAAAIAALDFRVVTCLDLDAMPDAVTLRSKPVLAPSSHEPNFLTDWTAKRISTQGNQQNEYTLNYSLFFAPVGKERGLFKLWPEMVECAQTIVGVLQAQAKVDGCKSLTVAGMPQFGPVVDASGVQFHGATLALRIVEF